MIEIFDERSDPADAARRLDVLKRLSCRGRSVLHRGWVVAGTVSLFAVSLVGPGAGMAAAATDSYEVAFQANNNTLYSYTSAAVGTSTTLGMLAGTSPSSTQLSDGTFVSAFQANNSTLYIHKWSGTNISTTFGMDAGTGPALASLPTAAAWVSAFQANNDDLYIYTSAGVATNTGLKMEAGTSPSIAVQSNGKWVVAFQSNTNTLDTYDSVGNSQATSDGLTAGTNPSIIPVPDGSYEVAFEANNDHLSIFHTGGTTNNTTLGMDSGTSPSLAITAPTPPATSSSLGTKIVSIAEGQEGYQDDPSGTYCNEYSAFWLGSEPSECGNTGNYYEEWCADFAAWAWSQAGASFTYGFGTNDINAGAISFYAWAEANGTWHGANSGYTPQPGDAVVYALSTSTAQHVAIVSSYTAGDAGPNVVNGDWWVSGNGSVYAESDQSEVTSDGTAYPILGYATPLS